MPDLLGHQLGDDAFSRDGPPNLEALLLVQDLAVELGLRLDAQHPQRGRHVQVGRDGNVAKVHEEGHAPDGEPVWKKKILSCVVPEIWF